LDGFEGLELDFDLPESTPRSRTGVSGSSMTENTWKSLVGRTLV